MIGIQIRKLRVPQEFRRIFSDAAYSDGGSPGRRGRFGQESDDRSPGGPHR